MLMDYMGQSWTGHSPNVWMAFLCSMVSETLTRKTRKGRGYFNGRGQNRLKASLLTHLLPGLGRLEGATHLGLSSRAPACVLSVCRVL